MVRVHDVIVLQHEDHSIPARLYY